VGIEAGYIQIDKKDEKKTNKKKTGSPLSVDVCFVTEVLVLVVVVVGSRKRRGNLLLLLVDLRLLLNVVLDAGSGGDLGSLPGLEHGDIGVEDLVHLLQGAALGLGEHEEDVDGHGDTEASEDEVGAVLDRLEKWGDSVGESKVEGPVGGSGEGDSLGTNAERVDLSGVGPGDGTRLGKEWEGRRERMVRIENNRNGSMI